MDIGITDSLQKYLPDSAPPTARTLKCSGLRGEVLSLQIVYRHEPGSSRTSLEPLVVEVEGDAAPWVRLRYVDIVPVKHPTPGMRPDRRIGTCPGYYPDPLLDTHEFEVLSGQTRSIWATIRVPNRAPAGDYRLKFHVCHRVRHRVVTLTATIHVVGVALGTQKLKVIHWFHNDCLLEHYGLEAWKRGHWAILPAYLRNAADHGVNTITTPLFTPPLDTAVGTERPTVQLVDVRLRGEGSSRASSRASSWVYSFGFSRLDRWIDLVRSSGMKYLELSHLATQWGAAHCPKIVARVDGRDKTVFGWKDSSSGAAYRRFLLAFLPRLVRFLDDRGMLSKSFLHVSDEPKLDQLSAYTAIREILRQGAPELQVIEALSDKEFYDSGQVDQPIPATNHAQPFLDAGVPNLWTYYCVGQQLDVSNRFMDFSAPRTRILGWQLFKFGFEGFLQWGYNYWFRQLTSTLIDPFLVTDAGNRLPSGDAFVVYPGRGGPVDSLRWELFREAMQDLRALQVLQRLGGDSATARRILALPDIQDMGTYPRGAEWIRASRARVNKEIEASV